MPYSIILQFLVVFFAPLLPSLVLFNYIDPNQIPAQIKGSISNFTVKASGAFASYIILVLLAGLIYDNLRQLEPTYTEAKLQVRFVGNAERIKSALPEIAPSSAVFFFDDKKLEAKHLTFVADVRRRQLLTRNFRYRSELKGKTLRVELDPLLKNDTFPHIC